MSTILSVSVSFHFSAVHVTVAIYPRFVSPRLFILASEPRFLRSIRTRWKSALYIPSQYRFQRKLKKQFQLRRSSFADSFISILFALSHDTIQTAVPDISPGLNPVIQRSMTFSSCRYPVYHLSTIQPNSLYTLPITSVLYWHHQHLTSDTTDIKPLKFHTIRSNPKIIKFTSRDSTRNSFGRTS